MSQGSKQMQKTIPRSPQEEIEIQTDLKYCFFLFSLIGRELSLSEVVSNRIPLRLTEFYS